MTFRSILLAAAGLVALGSAAGALEGSYEGNGMTMTFNADGSRIVEVPAAGVTITESYTLEGDTLTVTGPADDMFCMGASGIYTVAEADGALTLTAVDDPCTQRADSMTAGPWTKKAE